MKRIRWDGRLHTEHAVIDADHQNLIGLFNQVVAVANHHVGKVVCNDILDKLIEHTKAHFKFEERLMEEYHYREQDEHTAEHAALLRQALLFRFDLNFPDSKMPLTDLSKDWLTFHMQTSDRDLTDFLAKRIPPCAGMDQYNLTHSAIGIATQ